MYRTVFSALLSTSCLAGMLLTSQVAHARPPAEGAATGSAEDTAKDDVIVVTGSILRVGKETALPLTTLTSEDLAKRGINTIADAVQSLSNNNAGALPTAFTANGAFAAGASGASLRGLTTSSTLVLFDGLRAAYYPLADDGTRNFVDLNTIPDAIVDRVQVLKDGASSTYGADAVAGVINIILKKEIKGFNADLSAGISERGDAPEQRVSLTYGYGDLVEQGFNIYVNGEYQNNGDLKNRDRGFPYNTADLSSLCATGVGGARTCRTNGVVNGIQFDGQFLTPGSNTAGTIVPVVRAVDATGAPAIDALGNPSAWQLLNPAAGCRTLTSVTLTPAQQQTDPANPFAATQCLQDNISRYAVISPSQERLGATAHLTVRLGDRAEAYALATYYQSRTEYGGPPSNVLNITTPGPTGLTSDTRLGSGTDLTLPVYVCPQRVNCTAINGVLNPNNPFAAAGFGAQIRYNLADNVQDNISFSRTYRGAAGVSGSFGNDWNYKADVTAMRTDLTSTSTGYIFVQHLLDVIADGSYNFVNPAANSAATINYLTPANVSKANSQLYQGQVSLTHGFFELPGGTLQVGVGGAIRYESIYDPSANPDSNGPTQRFFVLNPVGAIGHRTVYSGYVEANLPIVKQLDINLGGRYDSYSSGQKAFSPKVQVKFQPIHQLALRGSWSRGFRIPSFSEANGLPTTGFITLDAPIDFQAQHGKNTYGQNYSLGLTTVGTVGLKPERSTNITAGVVFQPVPWFSMTADYFSIEKTDLIVGNDYNRAIAAYYAGQPIPAGFVVTPDVPDPQFPAARPRIQFIQYGFVNANKQKISGIDLAANARIPIKDDVTFTSRLEATYVIKYTQTNGSLVQRFDGTLGPYVITSASGTPKWRGSWQNTLDTGTFALTATVNYTSGYENTAEDAGSKRGDCLGSAARAGIPATYRDGATPIVCNTKAFVDVDLAGSIRVNEKFTFYANVLNLFNVSAPYDPTTYGGYQYNPAWANAGIVGRYFRAGARVKF